MNVTRLLGLAAIGGFLMLAAPVERAQAVSLASPGFAAATVQNGSETVTEVRWGRHWGGGHRHRCWRCRW